MTGGEGEHRLTGLYRALLIHPRREMTTTTAMTRREQEKRRNEKHSNKVIYNHAIFIK